MDITLEIEDYINSQNQKVWTELKNKYFIRLIYDPSEYSWKVNTKSGIATIVTPNKIIEYHSFTHELLHIYLDYKGLSKSNELVSGMTGELSREILSINDLVESLYNFCSHKKMFPYYIEMGFSEYFFVQSRISFTRLDLLCIKLFFRFKKTKPKGINQLIGHSLALMNNVVLEDKPKCLKYLKKLKNINPDLYQIVEEFDSKWTASTDLDLASKFFDFENKLNNWLKKNKITAGNK